MEFSQFLDNKRRRKEKGEDYAEHWTETQRKVAKVIGSTVCETFIGLLVMISFVLMVIEADSSPTAPGWVDATNYCLLAIYIVEITLRLFVFRSHFFHSLVNNFDLIIIVVDLAAIFLGAVFSGAVPSFAALRICRMLRLARGLKVIVKFPQLALIVKGLVSGISAAFYGCGLLLMILTVWSVCAVQFIHPVNVQVASTGIYGDCERCSAAFSNVRNSMLTFIQQIIAGDSWGKVTVPIIEQAPETSIFFGLVFISIHVTIMNVILAVIVDTALKASQEDVGELLRHKAEQFTVAQSHLLEICAEMDQDGSGDLTEDELIKGAEHHQDFRDILLSMDVKSEDMHVVFSILDSDQNGTVNYEEFISELFKMKKHDSHTMLVFIKHYVTEIRRDVREQLRVMKNDIFRQIWECTGRVEKKEEKQQHLQQQLQQQPTLQLQWTDAQQQDRVRGGNHGGTATLVKDGSWGEVESLKELGEELRHLRKVISDELLLSMKEFSQKASQPVHLGGGLDLPLLTQHAYREAADPGQVRRSISPSVVLPDGPGDRRLPGLPPGRPGTQPRSTSVWGLKNCCAVRQSSRERVHVGTNEPSPSVPPQPLPLAAGLPCSHSPQIPIPPVNSPPGEEQRPMRVPSTSRGAPSR